MKWSFLRYFGNSSIVKGNYIWVLIVPVLAKFLLSANDKIEVFGSEFELFLPFNWVVLYFSSIFFAIGFSLYVARCPKIIKDNESYNDYTLTGYEPGRLSLYLNCLSVSEVENNEPIFKKFSELAEDTKSFDIDTYKTILIYELKTDRSYNIKKEHEKVVFWEIYGVSESVNRISLFLSSGFFGLGLLLLAMIFVQNICFVISAI